MITRKSQHLICSSFVLQCFEKSQNWTHRCGEVSLSLAEIQRLSNFLWQVGNHTKVMSRFSTFRSSRPNIYIPIGNSSFFPLSCQLIVLFTRKHLRKSWSLTYNVVLWSLSSSLRLLLRCINLYFCFILWKCVTVNKIICFQKYPKLFARAKKSLTLI